MKIFEVGGFVRDTLMGIESNDRDYVVVGSSAAEMLSLGFSKVGAAFPVFLHPETQDEYALARTEKKVGVGYGGFECVTDGCLDTILLKKFIDMGYNPNEEYSINALIQAFRHINR